MTPEQTRECIVLTLQLGGLTEADARGRLDRHDANVRSQALGEAARAAAAVPDFFRPGRTYTRSHHGETVEFRVTSVDTAPDGSYQAAFGWRIDPEEGWVPGDADDLDGWTEVREGGEAGGPRADA